MITFCLAMIRNSKQRAYSLFHLNIYFSSNDNVRGFCFIVGKSLTDQRTTLPDYLVQWVSDLMQVTVRSMSRFETIITRGTDFSVVNFL